jgi:hypothetical protein
VNGEALMGLAVWRTGPKLVDVEHTWVTAFGSPAGPAALALLRAFASRHGITLRPVGRQDGLVAVAGAHLWACATGVSSLGAFDSVGVPARETLGRCLLRAAGAAVPPREVPSGSLNRSVDVVTVTEWLVNELGPVAAAAALRCVAGDLASHDPALGGVAGLVAAHADVIDPPTEA